MNEQNQPTPSGSSAPVVQPLVDDASALQEHYPTPNFVLGLVAGIIAALVGAALWAAVTAFTHYQIGWMAVGVGVLVGLAVRKFGKGDSQAYAIMGAALALVGCALGNLLAMVALAAGQENAGFFQLFANLNPEIAIELMRVTFSPMDLLFYAIAVYEGYKFSIVRT